VVKLHAFSASGPDVDERSASRSGRFIPRKIAPGTHWLSGPQSRSGRSGQQKK